MKRLIIVVIFWFLPLAQLLAQNEKYSTVIARIKEQVKPSSKIDYTAEIKRIVKYNNNKTAVNKSKTSTKPAPKKIDYITKIKKILGIKDNLTQVKSKPKSKLTTSVGGIIPKKEKKTGRVVIISEPLKKLDTTGVNLVKELDITFNMEDYESVARWAEKNGKVSLIPVVMARYGDLIKSLSHEFGVNYRVIVALCVHESGGSRWAVSEVGASGLMQLMVNTAAGYGIRIDPKDPKSKLKIFDPYLNLRAGIHYYHDMLRDFGNDKEALMAYGLGKGGALKKMGEGIRADEYRPVQEVLYLIERVE